jgi:hypothetical protein
VLCLHWLVRPTYYLCVLISTSESAGFQESGVIVMLLEDTAQSHPTLCNNNMLDTCKARLTTLGLGL